MTRTPIYLLILALACSLVSSLFSSSVATANGAASKDRRSAGISSITTAMDLRELAQVIDWTDDQLRRTRGCEIQRRRKIAPTLCYGPGVAINEQKHVLDSECRSLAATAVQLPKLDVYTSPECRSAIENRATDLAYVKSRDALR